MTSKRGRDHFARMKPVLNLGETLLRLVPAWFVAKLLVAIRNRSGLLARALRYLAMRRLCESCGELIDVRELVFLLAPQKLKVGSRVSIHPMCYIDATGGIVLGDDVSIAHGVTIMSTNHSFDNLGVPIRDQAVTVHPVVIGNDVWIGAGAKILAGTRVGNGSVIAAGAVVIRDVEARSVVAGVPARMVKRRAVDE